MTTTTDPLTVLSDELRGEANRIGLKLAEEIAAHDVLVIDGRTHLHFEAVDRCCAAISEAMTATLRALAERSGVDADALADQIGDAFCHWDGRIESDCALHNDGGCSACESAQERARSALTLALAQQQARHEAERINCPDPDAHGPGYTDNELLERNMSLREQIEKHDQREREWRELRSLEVGRGHADALALFEHANRDRIVELRRSLGLEG